LRITYYKNIIQRHFGEYFYLLQDKPIVVVYTVGKVGSASVYLSLKPQLKNSVFFCHRLLADNISAYKNHFKINGVKPYFQKMGDLIYQKKVAQQKHVKIITLVRNPIERNVSEFFEHLSVYHKKEIDISKSEELIKSFKQNFIHASTNLWWQNEFEKALNLDLKNYKFNHTTKYLHIEKDKLQILLLRTDLDNRIKSEIISNFLQLKDFKIQNFNQTTLKKYSGPYQSFKAQIKFETEFLNRILDDKYTRLFFSEEERHSIKLKWGSETN